MELSLDQDEQTTIFLVSKEGTRFEIKKDYACLSDFLKTALIDKEAKEIVLKDIPANTLSLILEYLNLRRGFPLEKKIERPLRRDSKSSREFCKDEDAADFIDRVANNATTVEQVQDLLNVIIASNYMLIDCLSQLSCAKYSQLSFKAPVLMEYIANKVKEVPTEHPSKTKQVPSGLNSDSQSKKGRTHE